MMGLENSIKEFKSLPWKYRKMVKDCQQESDIDWFEADLAESHWHGYQLWGTVQMCGPKVLAEGMERAGDKAIKEINPQDLVMDFYGEGVKERV